MIKSNINTVAMYVLGTILFHVAFQSILDSIIWSMAVETKRIPLSCGETPTLKYGAIVDERLGENSYPEVIKEKCKLIEEKKV